MENRTSLIILALAGGALIWWLWRRNQYAATDKATHALPWHAPLLLPAPAAGPEQSKPVQSSSWSSVLPTELPPTPKLEVLRTLDAIEGEVVRDITMPRGIRNHNPMNLRYYSAINWNGQLGDDGGGYARFDTVENGIRAGVLNLINGYFKRGINTPQTIVTRYAPAHENVGQANYIRFVASQMGVGENDAIQPTRQNLLRLTRAIIHFENGTNPYMDSTLLRGIDAAMAAGGI